jgi:uncharacterized Zn finger protein
MDETVLRTPKCPKCTMTFWIGKPIHKSAQRKSRCHDCGLMHYDGTLDNRVVRVSVDSMGDVERAWG